MTHVFLFKGFSRQKFEVSNVWTSPKVQIHLSHFGPHIVSSEFPPPQKQVEASSPCMVDRFDSPLTPAGCLVAALRKVQETMSKHHQSSGGLTASVSLQGVQTLGRFDIAITFIDCLLTFSAISLPKQSLEEIDLR